MLLDCSVVFMLYYLNRVLGEFCILSHIPVVRFTHEKLVVYEWELEFGCNR